MEPVSMDAASERMSPKMFPVTMVSNWVGARMICIAALSTYMWESSTSGYSSSCTRETTSFHSWDTSRTLDFSTEQTVVALLRRLETDARDALNLGDGIDHGIEAGAVTVLVLAEALGLAEVDAADELADDHDVGALDDLALEGGGVDELREDVGGARLAKTPRPARRPRRPCSGRCSAGSVPLVAADRGQEDGVGGLAGGEGLGGGEGDAVGVDGGAADERLGEVEFDVVLGADLLKHFLRHLHDLGADAVAGKEGDVVVFGRRRAHHATTGANRGEAGARLGGNARRKDAAEDVRRKETGAATAAIFTLVDGVRRLRRSRGARRVLRAD